MKILYKNNTKLICSAFLTKQGIFKRHINKGYKYFIEKTENFKKMQFAL